MRFSAPCAIVSVTLAITTSSAQAAKAPAHHVQSDVAVAADSLWGKLLTRCGDTYYYAGSWFDDEGMLSDLQVGEKTVKFEYRGVRFNQVPIPVTEAERLNGITARVRVTMIAKVYRSGDDGTWVDGLATVPRNTADVLARALGDVVADMAEMGESGAMALELVKYKGSWAVARSSATSTFSFGVGGNYYELKDVLAAKSGRVDCRTGKLVPAREDAQAQAEAER